MKALMPQEVIDKLSEFAQREKELEQLCKPYSYGAAYHEGKRQGLELGVGWIRCELIELREEVR